MKLGKNHDLLSFGFKYQVMTKLCETRCSCIQPYCYGFNYLIIKAWRYFSVTLIHSWTIQNKKLCKKHDLLSFGFKNVSELIEL